MPITKYIFRMSSDTLYNLLAYKELVSKELMFKGTMYLKLANKKSESKELKPKETVWKPAKPGTESKELMPKEIKWKLAKPANEESEYSEFRSTLPVRTGTRKTKRYGDDIPGEFLLEGIYRMYRNSEKVDENAVANLSSRALRILSGFVKKMSPEEFLQCLLAIRPQGVIPGKVKWHSEELSILKGIKTKFPKTWPLGRCFTPEPGEVLRVDGNVYVGGNKRKCVSSKLLNKVVLEPATKVKVAKVIKTKAAIAIAIAAEAAVASRLVAADHAELATEKEAAKEPVAKATHNAVLAAAADAEELDVAEPSADAADDAVLVIKAVDVAEEYNAAADDEESSDEASYDEESSDEESYTAEVVTKAVPVVQAADDQGLAAAADGAELPANAVDDAVSVVQPPDDTETYDAAVDEELDVTVNAKRTAKAAFIPTPPPLKEAAKMLIPLLAFARLAATVPPAKAAIVPVADDAEKYNVAADDRALVDAREVAKAAFIPASASLEEAAKVVSSPPSASAKPAAPVVAAKAAGASKWSLIWSGVFSAVMVIGFLAVVLGLNLMVVGLGIIAGISLIVGGSLICGTSSILGMKTFGVSEDVGCKKAGPQKPSVVFVERATPPVAIFEKKPKDATSEKKAILFSSLGKSLFFKQAQNQEQAISRNESCYEVMRL